MNIRLSAAAVAVAAAFPFASVALAADVTGETVIVSANRVDTPDTGATYASEVHTRLDIERSGATSLTEFLTRQTSVQLTPNFGNRFTPSINMRGYGSNDGYQNVVVSVDGRRLNSIDMVPQLLGAIPLADIDRIEITKGSGSVLFGDGATAGTIQIYTKPRTGASVEVNGGNFGALGTIAHAGYAGERISASVTADHSEHDGFSDKDPSGHRDESTADNWRATLSGKPVDRLKLNLDLGGAHIDTRYPGSLSLAQFRDDPATNSGRNYTHQKFRSEHWGIGGEFALAAAWRLSARHFDENKMSEFVQFSFKSDYRQVADELAVQYLGDALTVTGGMQALEGVRDDGFAETYKRADAWFVQGQFELGRTTLSAGARSERVEYEYDPSFGARLKDDKGLASWDLGANYRVSEELSVFGNYNYAYQAPDIDRFFVTDFFTGVTNFNGFIKPAKVRTVSLGLNHVVATNRLKLSAFHADLKNEIYYNAATFTNTNIDKSHKYGLEVQDSWRMTPILTGVLNYTWTRAVIDREDMGGGAFDGKELPGVPRHNVVLGLNVAVGESGNLYLSHTWRSKAWAYNDFDNNNAQKQREYQSTDLAYRHRLKSLELYAAVSNLFGYENGTWVRDNAIYPIDFERTLKLGAKLSF